MIMHTKGLTGALRRSLNSGLQKTFVRHSGGPTLHRCPLFLEHYIPEPYLQQKYFPQSHPALLKLGTILLAQGCQTCSWPSFRKPQVLITDPKSITFPLLKRHNLANKPLLTLLLFCASPKTLLHFSTSRMTSSSPSQLFFPPLDLY